MKRKLYPLVIFVLITISFAACRRNSEKNINTDVESDYISAEDADKEDVNEEYLDEEYAEIEDVETEDDEEEEDYEEEDFSYINIDGFDVMDDRFEPAHLKGFDTMQSAIDYYDEMDYVPQWSVLWVVISKIDADGTDENNNKVHDVVEMTQDEVDFYSNEMSAMFEEEVEELSLSHVDIVQDVLVYDSAINHLEEDNAITPESFDDETREMFKDYNSVICCVKLSNSEDSKYGLDWLGLSYGILEDSYGFCEVRVDPTYEYDRDPRNTYPAEPWIHEWQHTLQPLGTMCGRVVADPDEGEDHGYDNENTGLPINGFWRYYADTISGSIDNNEGITPGMWRAFAELFAQTRGI